MDNLRKLQLIVLDIAKDIDRLCQDNGIEYYLGGGGAIGAIRHKGYIPWDDDLDFLMTYENYESFVKVCESKLNKKKYLVEPDPAGRPFMKIKLIGTKVVEKGKREGDNETNGIFLDVFRLEKAPDLIKEQKRQYYFSKIYVAYCLSLGSYVPQTLSKKVIMSLSKILAIPFINKIVSHQIFKYNDISKPKYYACLWGITRFKNTFTSVDIYGKPLYVPFEDTMLPVPEKFDEYLTQFFGDYMQLPPEEKRVAPHILSIDFGKY